jgi:hypothetical protein
MRFLRILAAILALPVLLTAQQTRPIHPPPRSLVLAQVPAPWALSLAERAAKRAAAESRARQGKTEIASVNGRFRIDGGVTPELFFPFELFTQLVPQAAGTTTASARVRASYAPQILSLGWQPDPFWRDVVVATQQYRELIQANPRPDTVTSRKICLQRAEALRSLRRRYPRFDEFLYRAIAPRTVGASSYPSEDTVIWIEGGCQ